MRRRDFITVLGTTAAAWPLLAHAQQPTPPAIGVLDSRSPEAVVSRLRAFRQGLQETGYVEGENVAIVYRFAENQLERLSDLAKDLVERRVAVIVTLGEPSAFAAKAATTTIPVVFGTADDPVKVGLVTSLARPGGNVTGINFLAAELTAKRLDSIRPRQGELNPRSQLRKLPLVPWACKSRCSKRIPAVRSRLSLRI
jgi:putative tryptophan/tyrosine transport system substrate-binding protein